eukprot:2666279-Prymnesium_polylepis.1
MTPSHDVTRPDDGTLPCHAATLAPASRAQPARHRQPPLSDDAAMPVRTRRLRVPPARLHHFSVPRSARPRATCGAARP